MIQTTAFEYSPAEEEAEKASNSYLISLVASIAGLPLPIVNLLATLFFYIGNKRGTYFVRWHCTQALLAQFSLLFMNSAGFWWTISIVFGNQQLSNAYVSYMLTVIIFNLLEFLATIYTSIQTRKGKHVVWWFYGELANKLCKR